MTQKKQEKIRELEKLIAEERNKFSDLCDQLREARNKADEEVEDESARKIIREDAHINRMIYEEHIAEGFNEEQAFDILMAMIADTSACEVN